MQQLTGVDYVSAIYGALIKYMGAPVAQLVEHELGNLRVVSSSRLLAVVEMGHMWS